MIYFAFLTDGAKTGFFLKNPVFAPSKKEISGAGGQRLGNDITHF